MDARAYFSDSCTEGSYDHTRYSGLKLLGQTLKFTTDISGAGCGCNAALYLVSMKQNSDLSSCNDYYCDANEVCDVSCAEVDIMEANNRAWHSTLHSAQDHAGKGAGYGGGSGWNGPRDFNSQQYGPGGSCIDTSMPFDVAVSFPVDTGGQLQAMKMTLTQTGTSCPLNLNLDSYAGMAEIHDALGKGMTPVISYWKSGDMLWMDGKGSDGQGPCAVDTQRCGDSVKFYNFKLEPLPGQPPLKPTPVTPAGPATVPPLPPLVSPVATLPPFVPIAPTSRTQVQLPPVKQRPAALVTQPPLVSTSRWSNRIRSSTTHMEPAVAPIAPPTPITPSQECSAKNQDCRNTHCCTEPGTQCYQKNKWWASCKETCTPGVVDPTDAPEFQSPWSCKPLGQRAPSSPASTKNDAKNDVVVVRIRQGLLPQNAKVGTEATLTIGGKKVRTKIIGVQRGVQPSKASSSGGGSSVSNAGSTSAWSVVSFLLTLMVLAAVGLWAWRSRAGDAAPEWLKNFPNAIGATSTLERWRRQRSTGAGPPGAPLPPPTSTWFLNTLDQVMNRNRQQQDTPGQQGRQTLIW